MKTLLQKYFTRNNTSNKHIPYIDGIKFFTTFSIVASHYTDYYKKVYQIDMEALYPNIAYFYGNGYNALLLFFCLSGFLLSLPFARAILCGDTYPSIKYYFLRRLTRIEPPYIVMLIGMFVLIVFVLKKTPFLELLPHFLASLVYLHNIIYQEASTLNFVLWSLEIEVQFYVLAPLLVSIFYLPHIIRRLTLLGLIVLFSILPPLFPFKTVIEYLPYFFVGFLITDMYIHKESLKNYLSEKVINMGILIAAIGLWLNLFPYEACNLVLMVMLCIFIPISQFFTRFFSSPYLGAIGLMSYTIYMLHLPAMAIFYNRLVPKFILFDTITLDYTIKFVLMLVVVLCVSIPYYLIIERPTMNPNWYKFKKK